MATVQLKFSLRTSANCKTVHLLGSWDTYTGQLPLSQDPAKAGAWSGTFRFQPSVLKQGQRYWYYYIIDGYHVSHDPAREFTTEPTTGRKLNILDVPRTAAKPSTATGKSSKTHSRVPSREIPKGRSLSPSKIVAPKPINPMAKSKVTRANFDSDPVVGDLVSKLCTTTMSDSEETDLSSSEYDSEDDASDVPSLSSSRSTASRTSSLSSTSSCCTCERYGITRAGVRVRLDCGGSRCGSSDEEDYTSGSDCSDSEIKLKSQQKVLPKQPLKSTPIGADQRRGVVRS